ncbi:HTH-type transcriptional regulator ImmR [Methylococcales bacterium]|nr:HTH-type transcriptional regulator ImmR [Methylococcales bacterium]
MSVAERLRESREAAGLSQGQVAKKIGMHRPTISEIEAGRRKVTAEEIDTFANLYGVSIEWIVSGSSGNTQEDARILMAARELSKMSDTDLDRLMKMLKMLRTSEVK